MGVPKNLYLDENYVKDIEAFARALYARQPEYTVAVLNAIKDGTMDEAITLQDVAKKLDITSATFNAIIRKLKALGIIQKHGWHGFRWSKKFQLRLYHIMEFFAKLSGKMHPYQEIVDQYKAEAKRRGWKIIIEPLDQAEEEERVNK